MALFLLQSFLLLRNDVHALESNYFLTDFPVERYYKGASWSGWGSYSPGFYAAGFHFDSSFEVSQSTERYWPYDNIVVRSSLFDDSWNGKLSSFSFTTYFKNHGNKSLTFNGISCSRQIVTKWIDTWTCNNVPLYSNNNVMSIYCDTQESFSSSFIFAFTEIMLYESSEQLIVNHQQEIIDKFDQDLPEDKTSAADDSGFKDYESAESQLTDVMDDMDLDEVKIDMDLDTSNFIWSTMTTFIESHPAIFTMFVSVLSIGVIKLMFGR